jgi:hypothetical protein
LQASIPRELDQLVVDCLAKDPDRRPKSVSEIIQRLEAIDGLAAWNPEIAQRWWSEHLQV